jgi:Protein of unknown function (DUF1499)
MRKFDETKLYTAVLITLLASKYTQSIAEMGFLSALKAPVINDVSTDCDSPPVFTQSKHPASLSDSVKTAIRSYYADLQTLTVPSSSPAAVLEAARAAALSKLPRASVVKFSPDEGVMELLDVTGLMKFKDDIVVRCVVYGASQTSNV